MKGCFYRLKGFFANRNGLVLVFANFLLAILGIRDKGWNFSGFHWFYEPLEIKILTLINIPAIFIAQFFYELFFTRPQLSSSLITIYNVEMMLIVLFSNLQWLLVGSFINFPFQKPQEKNK